MEKNLHLINVNPNIHFSTDHIHNFQTENGEGLSILHYEVGQKFDPHYDYSRPESFNFKTLGQRIATLVMYL